jgi:LCP family protein required for cell wall assembly
LIRFALGAAIVIGFSAAATAVAGLLQFKEAAHFLSATPAIKHAQVTIPDPGNPQTLLIIGSDHRAGTSFRSANTDTMMLVRLDPNSTTINVLSIPRDLRVDIAGEGTAKLNSAYSVGGPNLLIRTLRGQVFPDLHVNHILDVNFGGFEALVQAIGCVYTDVDHRYYNNTAITDYSSINLQAGYQKLCGADALSFVRFRHTDNDIVRNARQQDFIRWAKDQYGPTQLIDNRNQLLQIFGQHVQTDQNLHTTDGLINLFNLVAFSAGHTIKQVPFPAVILPCAPGPAVATRFTPQSPCYVTADPAAERHAFDVFMTPTVATPTPPGTPTPARPGASGPAKLPQAAAANLRGAVADGHAQVAAMGGTGMPVFFPRLIAAGSHYEGPTAGEYPRSYLIHDQGGTAYKAYRLVLVLNPGLGQYYGVQGTTWQNPPILNNPTETRTVSGRRLELHFNGHKLTLVAWRTRHAAYWISNTLTDDLSNQQMIAIAASLRSG